MFDIELLLKLILLSLVNAIAIKGLFHAADSEMILEPLRKFFESDKMLGEKKAKPILGCEQCMASLWAGLPFLVFATSSGLSWFITIALTVGYTCVVSGWSVILKKS